MKHAQEHQHPKEYNIVIDQKDFKWPHQYITGDEVKKLVKAPSNYGVWLVVPGPAEDEEIDDHQKVDLATSKHHKFITGPKHTTEGDGKFLPSLDREYLTAKELVFEEVEHEGNRGVIIRHYPLPEGLFDTTHADILILLPTGYPDAKPDMFYTLPWVKLTGKNALPRKADQPHAFVGQNWQRWSRHNPEWRSGIDGIWTMLKMIDHALEVAVA